MSKSTLTPEIEREINEFEPVFLKGLNSLIDSFRNSEGTMPIHKLASMHITLLEVSGYLEAMVQANIVLRLEAQGHQSQPPGRLGIEEIYAMYTYGFNHGINTADMHKPEMLKGYAELHRKAHP